LSFGAAGFVNGRPHDGMAEALSKVFVATIESLRSPRTAHGIVSKPTDGPVRNHAAQGDAAQHGTAELLPPAPGKDLAHMPTRSARRPSL